MAISPGDTVRVMVAGSYQGQIVKVMNIDGRRMRGRKKRGYKLKTMRGECISTAYFTENEFEIVEKGDGYYHG